MLRMPIGRGVKLLQIEGIISEPQKRSGAEEEARLPRSFHRAQPVLFRVPPDFIGSATCDSGSTTLDAGSFCQDGEI